MSEDRENATWKALALATAPLPIEEIRSMIKRQQLRSSYEEARSAARIAAKFSAAEVPPSTCRYCGKRWRPFNGSALDGHAKCQVPESFKREIGLVAMPQLELAKILGVTLSVLRAWIAPIRSST